MSDEQSQLQGKEVTLTLRGSLQKLEDVIRTVVEVAKSSDNIENIVVNTSVTPYGTNFQHFPQFQFGR